LLDQLSSASIKQSTQNWHGPGESDCLINLPEAAGGASTAHSFCYRSMFYKIRYFCTHQYHTPTTLFPVPQVHLRKPCLLPSLKFLQIIKFGHFLRWCRLIYENLVTTQLLLSSSLKILPVPQVHLEKPCYDFYFLQVINFEDSSSTAVSPTETLL